MAAVWRKMAGAFAFDVERFRSFEKFTMWMCESTNPSGLGVIRICFGTLMVIDTLFERGGLHVYEKWGNPNDCHFPLFAFWKPLSVQLMIAIYLTMFLCAIGITVGLKFKFCALVYCVAYWYILLLDKSYWNNHSYLFGIISLMLLCSSANHFCSLDAYYDKSLRNKPVPFWNYFLLKFQFFFLYFMAGLKKLDTEWLDGFGLTSLGSHWVFAPFRVALTVEQVDYLIVHWIGFLLDLTIGFWLVCDRTRVFAMIFSTAFHLMNSRLFRIGMFPYVCIVTTPIFCKPNWPQTVQSLFRTQPIAANVENGAQKPKKIASKERLISFCIIFHCILQFVLPYSHVITKGYNNWTNGLYGYSWDMMVHSWSTALVVVKIVDNNNGAEFYLEPNVWTPNDRWNKHGDMVVQYARCIQNNLASLNDDQLIPKRMSTNISIYIDVWCSLNGRFQQRLFDPNYDLLKAKWSPFSHVEWLLPLQTQNDHLRTTLRQIETDVYAWSNRSDVLFIADFPGMRLENYLSPDLSNVTLTILNGSVLYVRDNYKRQQSMTELLTRGATRPLPPQHYHVLSTVGSTPALYMYTYYNLTRHEGM